MAYTNVNQRIDLNNLSAYNPAVRGQDKRQFNSDVRPVLTSGRTGTSFENALSINSKRFRDPADGQVKYIKVRPVEGVSNTYEFQIADNRTSVGVSKLGVRSTTPTRREAALVSTPAGTDISLSGKKYQDINDKNKQAHHLIELVENAPAFAGRSPQSVEYIHSQLNKHGFYPGDDRRNYAALRGNIIYGNELKEQITTGKYDEHQGGVHSKNSLASQAQKRMPTAQQFQQMTDDEVVTALLPVAFAARIDVQRQKNISKRAQAKQLANYYQADKAAKEQAKGLPFSGELPM